MAKVDHLACGQCGSKTFTLRHVKTKGDGRLGGGPITGSIRAICTKCKSCSTISMQPTITVDGTLCGGWG